MILGGLFGWLRKPVEQPLEPEGIKMGTLVKRLVKETKADPIEVERARILKSRAMAYEEMSPNGGGKTDNGGAGPKMGKKLPVGKAAANEPTQQWDSSMHQYRLHNADPVLFKLRGQSVIGAPSIFCQLPTSLVYHV